MTSFLLALGATYMVASSTPTPARPDVDSVFGFQELQLEAVPEQELNASADPSIPPAGKRAYVEDVVLGKRRLRVYVVLFKDEIEAIELQPVDTGTLPDLLKDLIRLYGPPTQRMSLATRWEGKRASLVWTQFYGGVTITLTSKRLEKALKSAPPPTPEP